MTDYGLSRAQRAYDNAMPHESGVCPRCAAADARLALSSLASDLGADWTDVLKAAADELADAAEENVDEVMFCHKHEPKRDDYED